MMTIKGWSLAALLVCGAPPASLAARPPPDIQFNTIGAPGNAAYPLKSPPGYVSVQGRGRVDYEYRIGKYEVTTAQWMEFVNTYTVLGGQWQFFADPVRWGAVPDPAYSGPGIKYKLNPSLTNAGMVGVYGISWRESAMFANWLHNEKASGTWAIENGAYDTSTFTTNPNGTFNDQLTHNPGAKYWIPTFDEHIKAAHYDPNRYGPGQGGYWMFSHGSDEPAIGGPPGIGQANTGFILPAFGNYYIPLGSYPETQSPWGLLDTAGASSEHTEFWWFPNGPYVERGARGSSTGGGADPSDRIYWVNANSPQFGYSGIGLRIAAAIPSPGSLALLAMSWTLFGIRKRRRAP
ncbi:MAG: SUMF1/EgtB/PvdO family nonheme iron enzyme [Phycisphaerales bacterium]